ncbi:hypothetical protein [Sandaracinus amylolyticus]|uniref:hypothetical protein n=1 Tax=Sandaracinus amylolyticus TaxID=927083 RepID=UPI001F277364|nr:hypothetical protein [Sandaracinus amylolyticus]UJR84575.1 Hypothetical protein I5071_66540 [Sandaracinus amylolyticus]
MFRASPASAQVCHRGDVDADAITWRTTMVGSAPLVGPLPPDLSVVSIEGGALSRGRDRIDATAGAPEVVLVTRQSIDTHDPTVVLRPPLVTSAQRIVLASHEGGRISFAPTLEGPIERHVGHHRSSGIDDPTRAHLDAWCGPRDRDVPTYLRALSWDDVRGELVRAEARRGSLLWIGWLVLAVGAIAGAIGYRRLAARAQVERADAVIESRFRTLAQEEGHDRGSPPGASHDARRV